MTCRCCHRETPTCELTAYNGRCENCASEVFAASWSSRNEVQKPARSYRAENRDEPTGGDGNRRMVVPWLE